MTALLLARLGGLLAALAACSLLVFGALELLPGSAAEVHLGETATPDAVAALEARWGLDRPAPQRYADWVLGWLLHGQGGHSRSYDTPVAELLTQRLAVSLPLAVLALALTAGLALPLGLLAAAYRHRAPDLAVRLFCQLGLAVPGFWVAILLILGFAVQLQWVQAGGFPGWTDPDSGDLSAPSIAAALQALLLPALALALVPAALLTRVTRAAVLEVLQEDFVRTARAKGLPRRLVLRRHVLRHALLPVLTVAGLQFANLLAGTVVIENVFVLPGVGRLLFQAVANRDLAVVRDLVMLLAATVIIGQKAIDGVLLALDPRLRRPPAR